MSSMKLIGSLNFAICFFLAVLLTVNGAPLLATLGWVSACGGWDCATLFVE